MSEVPILRGSIPNSGAGKIVRVAGDLNRDGLGDFLVSAYSDGGSLRGETYIVLGRDGSWPAETVLEPGNLPVFIGMSSFEFSGYGADGGGDFDCDGTPDVLIGAFGANDLRGRAYVISGARLDFGADGSSNFGFALADANVIIEGLKTNDEVGVAVSFVPDMDGDGCDELVLGTPVKTFNDVDSAGGAYWFRGRPTLSTFPSPVTLYDADHVFEGASGLGLCGNAVIGLSDFDGDGLGDSVVGCYGNGTVQLFLGGAELPYKLSPNHIFQSAVGGASEVGCCLADARDLNQDGYSELLVGDPRYGEEGNVFLVLGHALTAGGAETGILEDVSDLHWHGAPGLGAAVSAAGGDLDGDGVADLLFGANAAGAGQRGWVFVVSSDLSRQGSVIEDLEQSALWFFEGSVASDHLGTGVSGQVSGLSPDSMTFLLGALWADANGQDSGAVYIVEPLELNSDPATPTPSPTPEATPTTPPESPNPESTPEPTPDATLTPSVSPSTEPGSSPTPNIVTHSPSPGEPTPEDSTTQAETEPNETGDDDDSDPPVDSPFPSGCRCGADELDRSVPAKSMTILPWTVVLLVHRRKTRS